MTWIDYMRIYVSKSITFTDLSVSRFSTSLVVWGSKTGKKKLGGQLLILVVTPQYLEGQVSNCPWTSTAKCLNHDTVYNVGCAPILFVRMCDKCVLPWNIIKTQNNVNLFSRVNLFSGLLLCRLVLQLKGG